ncbi:MAG: putative ABC transporter substrate binding protein [Chloroflexi bacterium OLB15]|nr:MAG: putative ABC transporter substrate binding protein [Chloroflexi bacterium OLB15]
MTRKTRRALVVVALTLMSCSSRVMPVATPTNDGAVLRVFATNTTLPLMQELSRAYTREHTNIVFEIETGSFETLLQRLHTGDAPYFLSNHLPPESEQDVSLWAAPVGQDGIAVITHPDNPLAGLSRSQLRDVFQGRITNWQQLGGADLLITVISRESGSGTRAEFESLVMGSRSITPSARVAPGSREMISSVARDPSAVGFVSRAYLDDRVRALQIDAVPPDGDTIANSIYPLRSILYIIGLREPDGTQPLDMDYRAFIGWVQSPEGQAVLSSLAAPLLPLAA